MNYIVTVNRLKSIQYLINYFASFRFREGRLFYDIIKQLHTICQVLLNQVNPLSITIRRYYFHDIITFDKGNERYFINQRFHVFVRKSLFV